MCDAPAAILDVDGTLVDTNYHHALAWVGDSTWDCLAAARAGIRSIAVATGGFCSDELEEAGAERVVEDLAAVARHFGVGPHR